VVADRGDDPVPPGLVACWTGRVVIAEGGEEEITPFTVEIAQRAGEQALLGTEVVIDRRLVGS
jgi:hypothetical protein